MSRARDLAKLGNTDVIAVNGTDVGFGTLDPKEKVNVVGVVSATSFYGDGSTLDGIASAGIGTALSDDKTKALNAIYYTNQELTLNTTSTINPPDSGHIAYTQAPTVVIDDTKELIVSDGDDLLVDVLGIATGVNVDYAARGNGVFGNIYVDNILNQSGQTSVNFPKGLVSSGITTITNVNQSTSPTTGALQVRGGVGIAKSVYIGGNLSVGGTITYEDVTNVDSIGIITARDGIDSPTNLLLRTGGTERARIDSTGRFGIGAQSFNDTYEYLRVQSVSGAGNPSNLSIIGGNAAHSTLNLGDTDDFNIQRIKSDHSTNSLQFYAGDGERLRIGSAGQLGLAGANYGSSGQVMTSQGASAAPQWADVSGGIWSTLASGTVTSGTTGTITDNGLSSTYSMYKIVFYGYFSSVGTLGIDITTDGGSTWTGGGWTYSMTGRESNSNWGSDASSQSAGWLAGANRNYWWGEITFGDVTNSSKHPSFNFVGGIGYLDQSNHGGTVITNMHYPTTTAFNGIRWYSANAAMSNVKWVFQGTTFS